MVAHSSDDEQSDFTTKHFLWALSLGFLSAVSLQLGSAIGVTWSISQAVQGSLVAFGGGALFAALSVDLIASSVLSHHEDDCNLEADKLTIVFVLLGCLIGGLLFVALDALVNRNGGFFRKTGTKLAFYREQRQKRRKRLMDAILTFDGFSALGLTAMQNLVSCLRPSVHLPGEPLYRKGEVSRGLYFIMDGSVNVKSSGATRYSCHAGETLGEVALLCESPHKNSAYAKTTTSCLFLLKADFVRLRVMHPELDVILSNIAAKRVQISAQRKAERFEENMLVMDALSKELKSKSQTHLNLLPDLNREKRHSQLSVVSDYDMMSEDEEQEQQDSDGLNQVSGHKLKLNQAPGNTSPEDFLVVSEMSFESSLCELGAMPHPTSSGLAEQDSKSNNSLEAPINSVPANQVVPAFEVPGILPMDLKLGDLSARSISSVKIARTKSIEASVPPTAAPLAIWLGILLDGIPESFVIGSELAHSIHAHPTSNVEFAKVFPYTLIAGLFLSNFPEALSSSSSMISYGYSKSRVLLLWFSLVVMTTIGAGVGYTAGNKLDVRLVIFIEGVAAGAMLTMICANMISEAVHLAGPNLAGVSALGGFIFAIAFKLFE